MARTRRRSICARFPFALIAAASALASFRCYMEYSAHNASICVCVCAYSSRCRSKRTTRRRVLCASCQTNMRRTLFHSPVAVAGGCDVRGAHIDTRALVRSARAAARVQCTNTQTNVLAHTARVNHRCCLPYVLHFMRMRVCEMVCAVLCCCCCVCKCALCTCVLSFQVCVASCNWRTAAVIAFIRHGHGTTAHYMWKCGCTVHGHGHESESCVRIKM